MAYVLQIACIAVLAELLLRIVPVASAGFRYAYWRLALGAALLMPWVLRAGAPAIDAARPVAAVSTATGFVQIAEAATVLSGSGAAWLPLLPWLLAAGTAARLLWVLAGIVRLRALRRQGTPVSDMAYVEIQERLGTRAELRCVAGIAQPVTFGVRRPVVLLPASLDACSDEIRRAVATHELVHVRRRDWLWVMAEEALRAAFWFHPAIWWMTSRVQLTREEFTDHLAVLATGSRRSYMEALLTFADTSRIAPAPAFARRAHLFHRIVLLSKESAMSSRRIVLSGAALAVLLLTGGWFASRAFPVLAASPAAAIAAATQPELQAQGTALQPMNPITPENPIPRRVLATPIRYPQALEGTDIEGAVELQIVLNSGGAVTSTRVGATATSSPSGKSRTREGEAMKLFTAAAIEGISQWQYDPPFNAPIAFYVGVAFKPGADATVAQGERGQGVSAGPSGARLGLNAVVWTSSGGAVATLSESDRGQGVRAGSIVDLRHRANAAFAAAANGRRADPAPVTGARPGTVSVVPPASVGAGPGAPPDVAPLRVGGSIRPPVRLVNVAPAYPEDARAARIQGVVILEATVGADGRVSDARVLRSVPLLDQAALAAVRQWEYQPTLMNGVPMPVTMTVTVQFSLAEEF